jgi:hypothetical protein
MACGLRHGQERQDRSGPGLAAAAPPLVHRFRQRIARSRRRGDLQRPQGFVGADDERVRQPQAQQDEVASPAENTSLSHRNSALPDKT